MFLIATYQTNKMPTANQKTQYAILIVEDEMPMAKALEIKLTKSGYQTKSVSNGQEALDELQAGNYDLVLLDIMMPVMDGWAFLEHLKTYDIKTKVVVTSNLSQEEDFAKARSLGALDFLIKSNEPLESIVDKVKSVLNG